MNIVIGQRYVDGWGTEHTIVGEVPGKPGEFWTNTGYRFLSDGRMQFRVSPELSKFDLKDPHDDVSQRAEEREIQNPRDSTSGVAEQRLSSDKDRGPSDAGLES